MLPKSDRSLLATYLRPRWPRVVSLGLLLFAGIGLQLANPQIAKAFIDQAVAGAPFDELLRTAAVFLGVAETYVADNVGWHTTNALRNDLTRHVLSLDGSFHAEHSAGELIERIDGDVSAIASFFSRFVVHVLGSVVFLLGVLLLLYREDRRVGALLTIFALGAAVLMVRGGRLVGPRARAARQAAGRLSGYIEERLGGLPDIKANGADAYTMRRLHERLASRFHRDRDAAMAASAVYQAGVGILSVAGTGAALALSAVLHGRGAITLGTIYLVFRYTTMLEEPLQRLARHMNIFQQARGAIVRVHELLGTKSRVAEGPGAAFPDGALSVELERVSFAYDSELVLRDLTCRIQPGQVLGLLGRTGSGKTTISRLLFRLHDPSDGVIRVGGTDIRETRLNELRGRIGLVTQDVQLFAGTLRDNVALFDPSVPDERLREVFAELGLGEWLGVLPAGLATLLGPGGRGMSAGEEQLVALARVFLTDPGLVVLDEASSRLDPATERLLDRAWTRLLDGRTAIVVAHRLATVQRADTILILEDGRVAELGRRTDLASDPASRFAELLRAGTAEVLA